MPSFLRTTSSLCKDFCLSSILSDKAASWPDFFKSKSALKPRILSMVLGSLSEQYTPLKKKWIRCQTRALIKRFNKNITMQLYWSKLPTFSQSRKTREQYVCVLFWWWRLRLTCFIVVVPHKCEPFITCITRGPQTPPETILNQVPELALCEIVNSSTSVFFRALEISSTVFFRALQN